MEFHAMSQEQVLKNLAVDVKAGLSTYEVNNRQKKYGLNQLTKPKGRTLFQKLLDQLGNFLVLILVVAAFLSIIMGEYLEASLIISIIIINAIFGLIQENKADKALDALSAMGSLKAKVLRNYLWEQIPSEMLVPGDIVLLETGDNIPADLRLIDSCNLEIQEAALTGESIATEKDGAKICSNATQLGERKNMAFMNTTVTYGRGLGVVVATGMQTEIGKIAQAISFIDTTTTPLQERLAGLGKRIGLGVIIICAVVFITGLLRGLDSPLHLFLTAISLAVAAVPEGLAAIVTIILALGMTNISKNNAVIRKLLAVETLGTITVICADKTGTLTQNQMTVTQISLPDGYLKVTGSGYKPFGLFELVKGKKTGLNELLTAGLLCNDAELIKKNDHYNILGDPTEGALVVVAHKAKLDKNELNKLFPRVLELPFESKRKCMSTLNSYKNYYKLYVKGAPDEIIKKCTYINLDGQKTILNATLKSRLISEVDKMSAQALRVMAFAYKDLFSKPDKLRPEDEASLVYLGLMGMIDPPRKETKEAISKCRLAGIKPIMVTGDYAPTALAIGQIIGISDTKTRVVTGQGLSKLTPNELQKIVEEVSIFARVSPDNKVMLVQALKENGHIVAMTGDGVNDAIALKRADIGIAMGLSGTDVAKQTSDMVLLDDNFASIVSAINEGRIIYTNIRKVIYFLLSCNLGEVMVIFISMLIGLPLPLTPVHLLWINLVTDAFPALALGVEAGEEDIMQQKPRSPKEPLLDKKRWGFVLLQASLLSFLTLLAFLTGLYRFNNLALGRTMAFLTLTLGELFKAFNCRFEHQSVFKKGLFSNRMMIYAFISSVLLIIPLFLVPSIKEVFSLVSLTTLQWLLVFGLSLVPLITGELFKIFSTSMVVRKALGAN